MDETKGRSIPPLLVLLTIVLLHTAAFLSFNKGFLLTRIELNDQSTCQDSPDLFALLEINSTVTGKHEEQIAGTCWTEYPKYDRVILIVIDALKYDFAWWKDDVDKEFSQPPAFQNKLPAIRDLLRQAPSQCFLSPFFSDPPTTTLQRLKGITTGGLPTFIEFKDDFSKDMFITEDNFIKSLVKEKKKVVFMGDDTWLSIYPEEYFERAYPFPSFDVKDLHSVDAGVLSHLYSEVEEADFDLLIAHFLGVDHVGHRYGPYHPEMEAKLIQMNEMLEKLIRQVKESDQETLVFVFGDHGMTADGNHGGATVDETNAALFVYSTRELAHGTSKIFPSVSLKQVDLVPTLSLILDVPIPFSNLGRAFPHIFFTAQENTEASQLLRLENLNQVLKLNLAQIIRYLDSYQRRSKANVFAEVIQSIDKNTIERASKLLAQLQHQGTDIARVLTQAEQEQIGQALQAIHTRLSADKAIFEDLDLHVILENLVNQKTTTFDVTSAQIILQMQVFLCLFDFLDVIGAEARVLWTQFELSFMILGIMLMVVPTLILLWKAREFMQGCNVNPEAKCFLVCFAFSCMGLLSNSFIIAERSVLVFVLVSYGLLWFLREVVNNQGEASKMLRYDNTVRPLLFCISVRIMETFAEPVLSRTTDLQGGDWKQPEVYLRCFLPLVLLAVPLLGLRDWLGELKDLFPARTVRLLLLQQLCLALYWIGHALEVANVQHSVAWLNAFPKAVYFISLLGISLSLTNAVPLFCITAFLFHAVLIVTGPLYTGAFLCLTVCIGTLSHKERTDRQPHSEEIESVQDIEKGGVVALLALVFFYSTSHNCTIDKIQINSSFVGFEAYNYYRGVILIGLNQFGPFLLTVFSLPMIGLKQKGALLTHIVVYLLAFSVRFLVTTCFVLFARRHLMVWAIFAPKYAYESLFAIGVDVLCIVCYLLNKRAK